MIEPMAALYAAVTAVEEGRVGEIELEFLLTQLDGQENRLVMTIRRDVKHYSLNPPKGDA